MGSLRVQGVSFFFWRTEVSREVSAAVRSKKLMGFLAWTGAGKLRGVRPYQFLGAACVRGLRFRLEGTA